MRHTPLALVCLCLFIQCDPASAQPADEYLVKQLTRPVPSETVLPFQNDWDFRLGPLDQGSRYRLNFGPVIPVSIGQRWNLLVQTSIPYVSQEDVFKGESSANGPGSFPGLPGIVPNGSYPIYGLRTVTVAPGQVAQRPVRVGFTTGAELIAEAERKFNAEARRKKARGPEDHHQDGLADIVQSFYLSPKEPTGGWDLGFGPAFLYPSATEDRLGNEKWGAGPTAFAVHQQGGWSYGILANHLWSFAGNEDRRSVNATYLQPFIAYSTRSNTTISLNTESTYDWNESQWLVPVNLSVAQLVRIGSLPVQFEVGARYFAEGPTGAPEWGLRFTVTPILASAASSASAPSAKQSWK